MIQELKAGQEWTTPGYKMAIRDIRDGKVIWDGNYDTGYDTPIATFEGFLRDESVGWHCKGERYRGNHAPPE